MGQIVYCSECGTPIPEQYEDDCPHCKSFG